MCVCIAGYVDRCNVPLHLRCGQAVFSHETALFFHDLTDREPLKYTITVRTGYNPSRLQEDGFQVYTVKRIYMK